MNAKSHRLLTFALVFFMAFTLTACSNGSRNNESPRNESDPKSSPTPEAETSTPASGPWELHYYTDSFRQPTSEAFVMVLCDGVFSNSATSNSTLSASVVLDKETMSFVLFEYGNHKVKNPSSKNSIFYRITMRWENGDDIAMMGVMGANGDRIYVDEKSRDVIVKALSGSGNVSFYIAQDDRKTTNYLFSVETANFVDIYQNLN